MICNYDSKLYQFTLGGNPISIPAMNQDEAIARYRMAASNCPDTLESWLLWRWLGRYDLWFLCNRILEYRDVSHRVHGKLIGNVQKFLPSKEDIQTKNISGLKPNQIALPKPADIVAAYRPGCPMYALPGRRNYYNMISRGHLKTSVITFAHSIQWVINYPNVRICIDSHTDGNVKDFLKEIKSHFTNSPMFRYLYIEHVPHAKAVKDFGNQEYFDTLARTEFRKEHTYNILSVGSAAAGPHYDVMFHDDIVDKETVKTVDQIETTKKHLADCDPLVHRQNKPEKWSGRWTNKGWEYLTGTFYDFSDANYSIYEAEKEKPEKERSWSINVQSTAPEYPNPDGPLLWPERWPFDELKRIELDPAKGPAVLAAQYLMNPIPPGTGLIENEKELIWTPRKVLNELYARLSLYVAIDLAGMEPNKKGQDNDYTTITVGGFGTDGHLYIPEIIHGRPSPEQVIEHMFDLYKRHPRITYFKVEKEAHGRVLLKWLKGEEAKRGIWLPIMEIQRDNQTSKQQKIRGLQPWFKRGMIHFADDLPCRMHIINEVMRFPKFNHDDILDTLCDLMTSQSGGVTHEVMGRQKEIDEDVRQQRTHLFPWMQKQQEETVDYITGW